LLHCSDQQGIVLAVSKFITSHNGNIVELDQYTDLENQHFFMRVKWDLEQFDLSKEKLIEQFNKEIGERFNMFSKIYYCEKPRRAALFVTKLSHCLYDILQRYQSNEWEIEIPLIISNHEKLRYIAEQFDIPYYVFPITKENKLEQEAKELALHFRVQSLIILHSEEALKLLELLVIMLRRSWTQVQLSLRTSQKLHIQTP